jgi:hypothetical protein
MKIKGKVPCDRPWRLIALRDVEAPAFSRPVDLNLGYTYPLAYAKTSHINLNEGLDP